MRKAAATRVLARFRFFFFTGLPPLRGTRGAKVAWETNCFSAQIGTVFAEYHFHRFHSDGIDLCGLDTAHAIEGLPLRLLSALPDHPGLVGILQRWRGWFRGLFSFHLAQFPQDFLLLGRHPFLHRVVHLQRLLQAEPMIFPPVSAQLFRNFRLGFAAACIAGPKAGYFPSASLHPRTAPPVLLAAQIDSRHSPSNDR
jgi:hypothetical protein